MDGKFGGKWSKPFNLGTVRNLEPGQVEKAQEYLSLCFNSCISLRKYTHVFTLSSSILEEIFCAFSGSDADV